MRDAAQHPLDLRVRLLLGGAADLAEAERAQRAVVARALADAALHLRDPQLRHQLPASGSVATGSSATGGAGSAAAAGAGSSAAAGGVAVAVAAPFPSAGASGGLHGSTSAIVLPRAF